MENLRNINGTSMFASSDGNLYYLRNGQWTPKKIINRSNQWPKVVYNTILYFPAVEIWNVFNPDNQVENVRELDYRDGNAYNTKLENLFLKGVD